MKTLVHYELEGLVRQGSESVWVPLGHYDSQEEAQTAIAASRWGSQIEGSRVVPLFRDTSGGYSTLEESDSVRTHKIRPHFDLSSKKHRELPVTLA